MWNAYLKWFNFKRRKPYKNTSLIGNPTAVRGLAEPPGPSTGPCRKAQFGKYEIRNKRKSKLKYLLIIPLFIILVYIIVESVPGMLLFAT